MLRLVVLVLVLLNSVYFAWSQGFLRSYGYAPVEQAEPQRLTQQIRPQAMYVLTEDEARRLEAAALTPPKPPECLQAGVFDEKQLVVLRGALEATLPPGTWQLETVGEPARWIIYMGRYPNAQALAAKRAELANLKLTYEPLSRPDMEPGLSLGAFETQLAAAEALLALNRRGIRTARVVQERAESQSGTLRIPAADDTLRSRIEELKPALAGKPLRACK
jgi:hypothetical protein